MQDISSKRVTLKNQKSLIFLNYFKEKRREEKRREEKRREQKRKKEMKKKGNEEKKKKTFFFVSPSRNTFKEFFPLSLISADKSSSFGLSDRLIYFQQLEKERKKERKEREKRERRERKKRSDH